MKFMFLALCFIFVSSQVSAKTAEELKTEIIELAITNTSNKANQKEVRAQLDELIGELTKLSDPITEKTWGLYAPGSWRQIWSDEADNSPEGSPQQELEKIFQYVTPMGRAVNLGERIFPDGSRKTFALEARGTVEGSVQTTEILKAFFMDRAMAEEEAIEKLSLDILENKNLMFSEVEAGTFPKGPIGAKSDLTFSFLDNDLKVGTAPNVYSGEIEMFVLIRQDKVQKEVPKM